MDTSICDLQSISMLCRNILYNTIYCSILYVILLYSIVSFSYLNCMHTELSQPCPELRVWLVFYIHSWVEIRVTGGINCPEDQLPSRPTAQQTNALLHGSVTHLSWIIHQYDRWALPCNVKEWGLSHRMSLNVRFFNSILLFARQHRK